MRLAIITAVLVLSGCKIQVTIDGQDIAQRRTVTAEAPEEWTEERAEAYVMLPCGDQMKRLHESGWSIGVPFMDQNGNRKFPLKRWRSPSSGKVYPFKSLATDSVAIP